MRSSPLELAPSVAPGDGELAVLPARALVTTHNQSLGRLGEEAAAQWYEANGFTIVDRNWRGHSGELDLVAVSFVRRHPQLVAFVEVKTRSSSRYGSGVLAVGVRKQQRIRRLAGQWLSEQRARIDTVRFDIVDVDARGHLEVYVAAF